MSLSKRRVDIDPETPVREVTDLLEHPKEEIEFRVGKRIFVIHESSPAPKTDTSSDSAEEDGADGLLAIAGAWEGRIDSEALIKYIYEMRELDSERERYLDQHRSGAE